MLAQPTFFHFDLVLLLLSNHTLLHPGYGLLSHSIGFAGTLPA